MPSLALGDVCDSHKTVRLSCACLCRYFLVPDPPAPTPIVPYTRVNHAKWMVTDNAVYVGTSNWYGVGSLGAVASVGMGIVDCKK